MFHLHHGNRLESLIDRLAAVVASPLADVFRSEQVVVQNPGMARWLAHGLAQAHGVAANIDFVLPASFVWDVFRGQFDAVPEQSAFGPEALAWRIYARLPEFLDRAAFASPRRYLRDDDDGRKRLQLATRIAGLFDQYLIYRPELIFAWERGGEAEDWQAELWRELVTELGPHHRAGLLRDLRDRPGGLDAGKLPERVCLFGITALAPAYLDIFQAIAAHTEVHVFLLSPSFQWWGDQVSERDQARRRDAARALGVAPESITESTGDNRLLATLAAQGREFYKALTERADDDSELYAPPANLHLLGTLQLDLLFLQGRGAGDGCQPRMPIVADDRSVQVHSCHAPIREVQVLHDQLLDLFERLPNLHPRDIVVMAPEISRYAPLIEAVFGGAPEKRRIPWSIADVSASSHDEPLIQTVLTLLQLPRDRLAVGSVLGWLNVPAFARRAGLPPESLPRLEQWLRDAGVRWGRDAAHRRQFGVDAEDTHTWAFGLRRLLLGYAMLGADPADRLVAGIAPHPDIEGMEAAWLGQLVELIDRLGRWAGELAEPATPGKWLQRLPRLLADFFAFSKDEDDAEQRLRQAFETWAEQLELGGLRAPGSPGLSFAVVHAHLATLIGEQAANPRFLNGAVTFCNMLPMRSIPFRVVCLLGMNDTDYPRRQPQLGFDRIARAPRAGDRSRRDDDHTLFLEALLSARDSLYLSYVGNDARDDSKRNPSVLVAELIDTIERGFELPAPIVQHHPLQPFSAANFRAPHFSYAAEWRPERSEPRPLFAPQRSLPAADDPANAEDAVITLDQLHAFFRDPAGHFLRERLDLRLFGEAEAASDTEDFGIAGLEAWRLRDRLLDARIDDADAQLDLPLLRALGELPHGPFGGLAAARIEAEAEDIAERVRLALHDTHECELDLTLSDGTRLTGTLRHIGSDAMLRYQAGKPSARGRLAMWIDHLALNALADAPTRVTRLIAKDGDERYAALDDAIARLDELVAIYRAGRTHPLPLFPNSAFAYAGKDDSDEALSAAEAQWLGGDWVDAEALKPVNAFVFRDRDPLCDDASGTGFAAIAEAVFVPLRAARINKRGRS